LIKDIENNLSYVENILKESDFFERVISQSGRNTPLRSSLNRSDFLDRMKKSEIYEKDGG
jgi:hypothetical protein